MQTNTHNTSTAKRATVYFDGDIHQALRLKAAASGQSMSELVNRAVSLTLLEDAEDISAHRARALEESLDFADVVVSLQQRGKL
jgi:plasmid stability protein